MPKKLKKLKKKNYLFKGSNLIYLAENKLVVKHYDEIYPIDIYLKKFRKRVFITWDEEILKIKNFLLSKNDKIRILSKNIILSISILNKKILIKILLKVFISTFIFNLWL